MIYCVEDDENICNLMIYALQSGGYQAIGCYDSVELFQCLEQEIPQCILLDIMLPNEDGISILKKLKENRDYQNIPVIMASAKGSEFDKVLGLDCGADDYLVKPFGMMEMLSRVKSVLRRCQSHTASLQLKYKDLVLDEATHRVFLKDKRLDLTLKEYELLKLFMSHPKMVYSREQLLDKIWGVDYLGESRTVDVHISTLRNKLEYYKDCIQTVRSVGYLFGESDEKENI